MAKYQVDYKKEVVEYYKTHGKAATMKKYNVSNTAIYNWYNKYEKHGNGGLQRKKTKAYTVSEKLEIIQFCKENGLMETYKYYDVVDSVVNNWDRKLHENGEKALSKDNRGRKSKYIDKENINLNEDLLAEVQRLRMENAYLKKLKALVQEREEKQKKKK